MTAEETGTQEQAPAGGRDPWVRVTLEAPRPLPLPSDTRQHLLNAKREVLLALRSLVDIGHRAHRGTGGRPRRPPPLPHRD